MAKQQPKPAPGKAVAKTKGGALVDPEMLKMMAGDSGKGVSTDMADNVVPLLYILQSNSPQLDRADKVKHLKGAKAGDIWFRGTPEFVDGEEDGIEGIPCYFNKCWIEWRPDRGGFVARHPERPKEAVQVEEDDKKGGTRLVWRMKNGNTVVETREHVILVIGRGKPRAIVVPMVSTNHTASKEFMGLMNNVLIPGTDKTAPSYGYVYRFMTVPKRNDKGAWYGWQISHAGEEDGASVPRMVDDLELYKAAKKINADFASGALRADVASDVDGDGEMSGGM